MKIPLVNRERTFRMLVVAACALAAVLLFSLLVVACGTAGLARVQLTSGPITGAVEKVQGQEIWTFKGIPYAAPPVGELRWKPPQPVAHWTEPRSCTAFGPSCPQSGEAGPFSIDSLSVGATSEDCLYLNVWSPAKSAKDGLPVMVWIHGGSFETGSGSMGVYDGGNLATRGLVIVTINYRLGPFGFLAHPALSAESPNRVSGNYGLLDQIAALQWVRDNIGGFGGDPHRVTVFGESAGAISILDLLVSPLADGLFQRAIAESGILLDQGFSVSTARTLSQAEAEGEDYANRLGVDTSGDVLAQMRAKTPAELLAAGSALAAEGRLIDRGLVWSPAADGYLLPDLPSSLWVEGKRQTVPLLIGSNADEGNAFLSGLTITRTEYEAVMGKIFGDRATEALALYPVGPSADPVPVLSRMLTEIGFASTARFAARQMSAPPTGGGGGASPASASAYLYEFTRVPLKDKNPLGAFHSVEIPYVFGNAGLFTALGTLEPADYDLSAAIMGYWTRFAATGDPNGGGAAQWPAYQPGTDLHLQLGDTVVVRGPGLYKQACDLADSIRGLAVGEK